MVKNNAEPNCWLLESSRGKSVWNVFRLSMNSHNKNDSCKRWFIVTEKQESKNMVCNASLYGARLIFDHISGHKTMTYAFFPEPLITFTKIQNICR